MSHECKRPIPGPGLSGLIPPQAFELRITFIQSAFAESTLSAQHYSRLGGGGYCPELDRGVPI